MPDALTQEALELATLQRRPPDALLHLADQGSQYTRDDYQALLAIHRMLARFSGLGCCYDNTPMERFWATLKTELVYRAPYRTRAQAKTAIFAYLEGTIANAVIRPSAISALRSSNTGFRLNFVSLSQLQDQYSMVIR